MEKKVVKTWFEVDEKVWKLYVAYSDDPNTKRLYHLDCMDRKRPVFDIYSIIGMTEEQLYAYVRNLWASKEECA